VLHATPTWSTAHLEQDAESLVPRMLEAFARVVGDSIPARYATGHRWRYAIPANGAGTLSGDALHDPVTALAAAGDWCVGGRVEGALVSGMAAADAIARALG
jgi:predicted NAD/FAD-dependent oxidoreductase